MNKKRVLKPIVQDFLIVISFASLVVAGIIAQHKPTLLTIVLVILFGAISLCSACIIDKYYKLPSLFLEARYDK